MHATIARRRLHLVPMALSCATLLLGSGCATTWTEADKQSLRQVAVGTPTVAPNAYHPPDARNSPGMSNMLPAAAGGGIIPALIGIAIDQGTMAAQQAKFERTAKEHFEELEQLAVEPPSTELQEALAEGLRDDSFFGPRLADTADHEFRMHVTSFGFVRSVATGTDGVRISYHLTARVTLAHRGGKRLLDREFIGVSGANVHVDRIPELQDISRLKFEAARVLVGSLRSEMNILLGKAQRIGESW